MGVLALDTETTGLGYFDTAFMMSWAWNDEGEIRSGVEYDPKIFADWITQDWDAFVFHNAKFDLQKLELAGAIPVGWVGAHPFRIHDTECMSHLLNEQQPKALKRLAKEILGRETDEETVLRAERRKAGLRKADGYDKLPREVVEPYARADAEFTLALYEAFWPLIENDPELLELYRGEQELLVVLYEMERAGLGVDMEYVNEQTKELAGEILMDDLAIRDMVGREEFNPASPKQLLEAFAERGVKVESTAKAILEDVDDDLARSVLRLRRNSKLHGSYFKALQAEVKNGILHPNFKQWGTRGRRFSAGETEG